jgi:hypothetical protein
MACRTVACAKNPANSREVARSKRFLLMRHLSGQRDKYNLVRRPKMRSVVP